MHLGVPEPHTAGVEWNRSPSEYRIGGLVVLQPRREQEGPVMMAIIERTQYSGGALGRVPSGALLGPDCLPAGRDLPWRTLTDRVGLRGLARILGCRLSGEIVTAATLAHSYRILD